MEDHVKDVFVVSDNIISSLGFTTEENIQSILKSKTGIVPLDDPAIYPEPFQAARINPPKLSQLIAKYNLTDYHLTEATAIVSILLTLEKTNIDLSGKENLLILSTTKGNIARLSGAVPPEKETYLGYTAERIAGYFQMKNPPVVVSNACVSGVTAIETAARLLEAGKYRNCIVIGIDFVTAFTVSGFQSFKSISPHPCKPYDKNRDGLSMGEGAGSILLTNDRTKVVDKQPVRIVGGATSNDANHISGPSRTGDGLSYAIENALKYSGVSRSDVDFINLHGTATIYNDEMESKALHLSGLSTVPANSLKGYFGHTLGASGVIETIVCIESLWKQKLFATLGFEELGTSEFMNIISRHSEKELHTFIKTASGFGGFNSAIVVTNQLTPTKKRHKTDLAFSEFNYTVENNQIKKNGEIIFETAPEIPFSEFSKAAFKNLNMNYMKFYKMDDLCKLAFLNFEYLLRDMPDFEKYNQEKIAIILSNSVSSLDTDRKHQQSINDKENYFPSPAVFVYTLPNIMLGEICIKNKIQGETVCFIGEKANPQWITNYIQLLFDSTDTELVFFGEINYLAGEYQAGMSFSSKL